MVRVRWLSLVGLLAGAAALLGAAVVAAHAVRAERKWRVTDDSPTGDLRL